MTGHRSDFVDLDEIISPPSIPSTIHRTERITYLESELRQIHDTTSSLSDINNRRLEMLRIQKNLNEDLTKEINRQKDEIVKVQRQHNEAIERMASQDEELNSHRFEVEYLHKLVDQLQPAVDQLKSFELELKTYRVAMRVLYKLLKDSGSHTSINEILARCEAQIRTIDASNGVFHAEPMEEGGEGEGNIMLTPEEFIDDIASEASRDEEIADDDSLHDFVDDGEDITATPPRLKRKQKRSYDLRSKGSNEITDTVPRTPKRARFSPTINVNPLTPPSSQRKFLPRKAKGPSKGQDMESSLIGNI